VEPSVGRHAGEQRFSVVGALSPTRLRVSSLLQASIVSGAARADNKKSHGTCKPKTDGLSSRRDAPVAWIEYRVAS